MLAPAPRRRWAKVVIGVSAVVHAGLIGALIVAGMWQIEKLRLERTSIVTSVSFGIPGPAAIASVAPPAPRKKSSNPSPHKQKVLAQPNEAAPEIEATVDDGGSLTGSDDGRDDGSDDGIPGGLAPLGPVTSGLCARPPCGLAIKEPPAEKPTCENGGLQDCGEKFVPPDVIEGLRTSGKTQIHPSETDKDAMNRNGDKEVVALVKLCLGAGGTPTSTSLAKSTGYPDYDQRFLDAMSDWEYQPYTVGGKPVPVCGMVTFQYRVR